RGKGRVCNYLAAGPWGSDRRDDTPALQMCASGATLAAVAPLSRQACWPGNRGAEDRKSTRLNSSHGSISYAVFCLKKKKAHREGNNTNKKKQRAISSIKPVVSVTVEGCAPNSAAIRDALCSQHDSTTLHSQVVQLR